MSRELDEILDANICKVIVDDTTKHGTGFLISNEYILTAFHVVRDYINDIKVKFEFKVDEIEVELSELIDEKLKKLDIALLKVKIPLTHYKSINFTDKKLYHGLAWRTKGFPQLKDGDMITSTINRHIPVLYNKHDLELDVDKGKHITFKGISGAPVIVDGSIVGIINQDLSNGEQAVELKALSVTYFRELLEKIGIQVLNKSNLILPLTISNNILNEVDKHFDLILDNDNNLKVFTPKLDGKEHDIDNFVNELYESIHTFMGNRLDLDLPRQEQMKNKLRKKFKENYSKKLVEELIGYNFLETDLNAPKIFTTVEHDEMNFAVHLHELKDEKIFVLTLPIINSDLEIAINDIKNLLHLNQDFKINSSMITENFLRQSFNNEHKEFIKSLVIPSLHTDNIIENAYGIFLGFDLSQITNKNTLRKRQFTRLYKKEINEIYQKVNQVFQEGLIPLFPDKYFFIYIIPFDSTKNLLDIAERVLND